MMTSNFPTFEEFFKGLVEDGPHQWQSDLAKHVAEGGWPARVEAPTGLGKTATIVVAIYELAKQIHTGTKRTAPQRIFHVVNRKVLVDDTGRFINKIAAAINGAEPESPLRPVREALCSLLGPGDTVPVTTGIIHGGTPKGAPWLRATGCSIVTLTPHQFVSRLVMRGFSVRPQRRPIDAGLVGVDRLVLFDEPHLSIPAVQTTLDAERIQAQATETLGVPLGCSVLLGATLPPPLVEMMDRDSVICVDTEALLTSAAGSSTLGREGKLLLAPKRIHLLRVKKNDDAAYVDAMVECAIAAVADGRSVVVFANTISLAQDIFRRLTDTIAPTVRLVTSRFRPLDRRDLHEFSGITVTTQCLEVGVDASFGALVTEAASWNALVQRLGRLNRRAEYANSNAYVVISKTGTVREGTEYIYGKQPVLAAVELLEAAATGSSAGIDASPVGIAQLRKRGDQQLLDGPAPRAATLHSCLIPLMTQTCPSPRPDLAVDAFVAGPDVSANRDIDVAWREHVDALDAGSFGDVYPSEIVSVPRAALAGFLRREGSVLGAATVADVTDLSSDEEDILGQVEFDMLQRIRFWDSVLERWQIPSSLAEVLRAERVVMSSELGGYQNDLGWTGKAATVPDVHVVAAVRNLIAGGLGKRRVALALSACTVDQAMQRRAQLVGGKAPTDESSKEDESIKRAVVEEALQELWGLVSDFASVADADLDLPIAAIEELLPGTLTQILVNLGGLQASDIKVRIDNTEIPLGEPRRRYVQCTVSVTSRGSAGVGDVVTLRDHLSQVGDWAEKDGRAAGLTEDLVAALGEAGRYHDVGKLYPPFQRMLSGSAMTDVTESGLVLPSGDSFPYLAKSAGRSAVSFKSARRADQSVRKAAGLDSRFRHEATSMAAYMTSGNSRLTAHLIGSHHGWCRPGFSPMRDIPTLGYSHAENFAALNTRFGPWGLAYLEAVMRLADWRASAQPTTLTESARVDSILESANVDRWHESLRRVPREAPQGAQVHILSGFASHVLTGWFAAFGLLAAAVDAGDDEATLHWQGDGTAPQVPVLATQRSLRNLVSAVCDPLLWDAANELIADVFGNKAMKLERKHQKLTPASCMRTVILAAEQDPSLLHLLGLLGDAAKADAKGQLELLIAPIANNSSYPGVAIAALKRHTAVDECLAAMTDLNRGYSETACDGGMDRPRAAMPSINGIGSVSGRMVRTALAPLALYGMGRLGNTGAGPLGVIRTGGTRTLVLPIPTGPVTLAELIAMTIDVRTPRLKAPSERAAEWVYAAQRQRLTDRKDVDIIWSGGVVRRSGR